MLFYKACIIRLQRSASPTNGRNRVCWIIIPNIGKDKSFVDDFVQERGTVSMRVAFVLRSAEVQPLFRDLCVDVSAHFTNAWCYTDVRANSHPPTFTLESRKHIPTKQQTALTKRDVHLFCMRQVQSTKCKPTMPYFSASAKVPADFSTWLLNCRACTSWTRTSLPPWRLGLWSCRP